MLRFPANGSSLLAHYKSHQLWRLTSQHCLVISRQRSSTTAASTSTAPDEVPPSENDATTKSKTSNPTDKDASSSSSSPLPSLSADNISQWKARLEETWVQAAGVKEISELKEAVEKASEQVDHWTLQVQQLQRQVQTDKTHSEHLSARHQQMLLLHNQQQLDETDKEGGLLDVQSFAQLTADERQARTVYQKSAAALAEAESQLQMAQSTYINVLRKRYQEEQVWQDKWRVLSTYWTWILLGCNSAVFFLGQFLHYRREEHRMKALQSMIQEQQVTQTKQQETLDQVVVRTMPTKQQEKDVHEERQATSKSLDNKAHSTTNEHDETSPTHTSEPSSSSKSQKATRTNAAIAVNHADDLVSKTSPTEDTSSSDDPSTTTLWTWTSSLVRQTRKLGHTIGQEYRNGTLPTFVQAHSLHAWQQGQHFVTHDLHWPSVACGAVAMWTLTALLAPSRR